LREVCSTLEPVKISSLCMRRN